MKHVKLDPCCCCNTALGHTGHGTRSYRTRTRHTVQHEQGENGNRAPLPLQLPETQLARCRHFRSPFPKDLCTPYPIIYLFILFGGRRGWGEREKKGDDINVGYNIIIDSISAPRSHAQKTRLTMRVQPLADLQSSTVHVLASSLVSSYKVEIK